MNIQDKLDEIKKRCERCGCFHCEQELKLAQALSVAVKALEESDLNGVTGHIHEALDEINALLKTI